MSLRKWKATLISLVLLCSIQSPAQVEIQLKRSAATVLFSSISGAVLGLSTLPFYGHPEEHTNNIYLGALIGFGAGVGYLVYDNKQSAMDNRDYSKAECNDLLRFTRENKRSQVPIVNLFAYSF